PELSTLYSSKFVERFGPPSEPRAGPVESAVPGFSQHQLDVAASLQAMLEEAEFALLGMLQRATGQRALCLAGGVALNSVFNGKILPCTPFDEVYVQPAAGDAGAALGAAYYIHHQLLGRPRCQVMDRAD